MDIAFENDAMWLFDPTLPATPAKEKRAYTMPTLASTPRANAMPKLANAIMGMSYILVVDSKIFGA